MNFQPINYEGFALFMETYIEQNLDDLFKHLFISFMKKQGSPSAGNRNHQGMLGKDLKDVAATACAAVVGDAVDHGKESTVSSIGRNLGGSIAEKLHGLSERIHQLGHSRHDSSGGDSGKRSRAGTLRRCSRQNAHPMHTHTK